jgi:transposase
MRKVKVANPLMLRAIAAAKRKNDRIDAGKIADCLRCDFRRWAESQVGRLVGNPEVER